MSQVPNRLLRISQTLFWLATLALVLYPLALALSWGHWDLPRLAALLAVPFLLGFLWHCRALFALYAAGQVLSLAAAARIQAAGRFATLAGLAKLAEPTLAGLLRSLGSGGIELTLGISEGAVIFLMLGGLLMVVGWATTEGTLARDDVAGFV